MALCMSSYLFSKPILNKRELEKFILNDSLDVST